MLKSAGAYFRNYHGVDTQKKLSFRGSMVACTLPCRRFAGILTDDCARLGADVTR
jgi:hypothetical protein